MSSSSPTGWSPRDPATSFDFYRWRRRRLALAYALDRLATRHRLSEPALTRLATGLEEETLRDEDTERLAQLLGSEAIASLDALEDALGQHGVLDHTPSPSPPSDHGRVQPNWDCVPESRPEFVGEVRDLPRRARPIASRTLTPPYAIRWVDPEGDTALESPVRGHLGRYLSGAAATWDWLFARRLTLLCRQRRLPWPDPSTPPLRLADTRLERKF